MNQRFAHVHFAGEWEPDFNNPNVSLREACARYAKAARDAGATALQLNFLAEPYAPVHVLHPREIYHYFTNYGAGLEYFAESEYSRGMWPRFLLEQNLQRLRCMGEAAEEFGLAGLLLFCEPRLQREEIFERFPHWRGPRVDNPSISDTPSFALNTDCPDVRDHYRRMLAVVLEAAPMIRDVVLFSQDSGSGFGYADHLYAGPNGGCHGKRKPLARRVLDFCEALRDEGRRVAPDFRVTVTTSFSDEEVTGILAGASDGVTLAIRGAMSWSGGLEDQWAWNDCGGGAALEARGFEASRQERRDKFRELAALARRNGQPLSAMASVPNEHYFQLKYVPNPWEQLDILASYEEWGVERLFGRGHVTESESLPYNLNQAAFARYVQDRTLTPEEAVRVILEEWFPRTSGPVETALREAALAVRQRPNNNLFFERTMPAFPGPLVPDASRLSAGEKRPFWHVALETMRQISGGDWWIPQLTPDDFAYVDRQVRERTLPALRSAVQSLETLRDGVDGAEREALEFQIHAISLFVCHQVSNWNIARMAMHWRERPVAGLDSAREVVLHEAENSLRWRGLLGEDPARWLRLSALPGALYASHPGLPGLLEKRAEIMRAHAADPVRPCCDGSPQAESFYKL